MEGIFFGEFGGVFEIYVEWYYGLIGCLVFVYLVCVFKVIILKLLIEVILIII